jgi:hypothetical protein
MGRMKEQWIDALDTDEYIEWLENRVTETSPAVVIRTNSVTRNSPRIRDIISQHPIDSLPSKVRHAFACVAYAESRDKVVDTNVTSGAQGKWQFLPWLWSYARTQIVGLPATPNQANEWQQDVVAWWFYTRNAGFYPEWSSDSQCF